jgi:hypothetical protein
MGVLDVENVDRSHGAPVEAAVGFTRNGVVSRFENQSIGMVEINRDLAFSVLVEFVASRLRESSHVFEGSGGLQLVQSPSDSPCSVIAMALHQQAIVVALLLQLSRTKEYIH